MQHENNKPKKKTRPKPKVTPQTREGHLTVKSALRIQTFAHFSHFFVLLKHSLMTFRVVKYDKHSLLYIFANKNQWENYTWKRKKNLNNFKSYTMSWLSSAYQCTRSTSWPGLQQLMNSNSITSVSQSVDKFTQCRWMLAVIKIVFKDTTHSFIDLYARRPVEAKTIDDSYWTINETGK